MIVFIQVLLLLLVIPERAFCSSRRLFLLFLRALLALPEGASAVPRRAVGRRFSLRCAKLIHFSINARLHRHAMKKYPFWRDKKTLSGVPENSPENVTAAFSDCATNPSVLSQHPLKLH
jgi:hypothetical protein